MIIGLSQNEAQTKLLEFGLNEIPQAPPSSWWKLLAKQFAGFVMLILVVAALISFFIQEFLNGFFILSIIFLNSLLGLYQELRAQKDIKSLKTLVTPKCRVIRNGQEKLLETKYLVPEDLVVLGTGDKIPADGVLLTNTKLLVNEAVISGESLPLEKNPQDKLFMATTVLSGHGQMKVIGTGVKTQFGHMAQNLAFIPEEKTPLEEKLDLFGKKLGVLIFVVAVLLFLVGVRQGRSLYALFLQVASIAVAAIPEGLPAVFTITLAIGVQRMAQQKAVMRRLSASEGLGSTNVICTDKTGTLTKNEMTVRKIWLGNGQEYEVTGVGYSAKGEIKGAGPVSRQLFSNFLRRQNSSTSLGIDSSKIKKDWRLPPADEPNLYNLIEFGVLCNSSSLVLKEDGGTEFDILGDTTEGALLILAKKVGLDIDKLKEDWEIVEEPPFDQELMTTSVVVTPKDNRNNFLLLIKGAPEKLIERCQIDKAEKEEVLKKIAEYSGQGLRVLAVAYKTLATNRELFAKANFASQNKSLKSLKEKNLTFVGLVGIDDAPRIEVKEAISVAKKAGIRTVMLTGDNPLTALKIAEEVGLVEKGSEVVTGEQLKSYSEQVFTDKLNKVNVFARVVPEDKLKIVEMLQKKGLVVAVTGDGVNDASALKKADIGVAMGITGTDVAKEVSDMVILDDNFTTIVKAVEEGRVIYDNILKAIKFLLISNLGESLTVGLALLFGWPLPLVPKQILWINLVTDGLPALAMAVDPKDPEVMTRYSRDRRSPMLNNKEVFNLGFISLSQAIVALSLFWLASGVYGEKWAQLLTFTILVLMEIILAFLIRGKRQKLFGNKTLVLAALFGLFSQFLILTVPFLRNIFS